jgi:hypothetical protein
MQYREFLIIYCTYAQNNCYTEVEIETQLAYIAFCSVLQVLDVMKEIICSKLFYMIKIDRGMSSYGTWQCH